jgi:hypothetical protein
MTTEFSMDPRHDIEPRATRPPRGAREGSASRILLTVERVPAPSESDLVHALARLALAHLRASELGLEEDVGASHREPSKS